MPVHHDEPKQNGNVTSYLVSQKIKYLSIGKEELGSLITRFLKKRSQTCKLSLDIPISSKVEYSSDMPFHDLFDDDV